MADILWLQQQQEDVPQNNDWLSPGELSVLDRLVFLKRRKEWRLGRWTAKCAFALVYGIPRNNDHLAEIEIRASVSGAPEVFVCDQLARATISISHSHGAAITAIAPIRITLGCDLEQIEHHTQVFVEDYFTHEEQILLASARPRDWALLTTLIWSAKESALKAMQLGLRADTRSVSIELVEGHPASWAAFKVICDQRETFHGWWRQQDCAIVTMVSGSASHEPVRLDLHEAESSNETAALVAKY